MKLPSPFPCDRCGWMRWDCVCDGRTTAQRLRGDEMSSRQQERAGESAEPAQGRSALVQEEPVLPPLTHAQIREALAFPDTPETATRSPWWPEEAA